MLLYVVLIPCIFITSMGSMPELWQENSSGSSSSRSWHRPVSCLARGMFGAVAIGLARILAWSSLLNCCRRGVGTWHRSRTLVCLYIGVFFSFPQACTISVDVNVSR